MDRDSNEYKEWLASISVGDQVVCRVTVGFERVNQIIHIERETPKRWVLPYHGGQVDKDNGKVLGTYSEYIMPVTDEVVAEVRDRNARRRVSRYGKMLENKCLKMPIHQVNEINNFLKGILEDAD